MLSIGIHQQPCTALSTLLGSDFGVLCLLWSQNDIVMSWFILAATSNCFPHPYYTYTKCLSTLPLICCPSAYHQQPYTDTHPTWLRLWGSGSLVGQNDVIMSRLTLTATPQTASHIQIRHLQSVWAHWYAVHQHTTTALHSFTQPTWLRCWGSGSLVESKWWHYVKVETDSHFKLLSPSI